jgi:hypothetical protein
MVSTQLRPLNSATRSMVLKKKVLRSLVACTDIAYDYRVILIPCFSKSLVANITISVSHCSKTPI